MRDGHVVQLDAEVAGPAHQRFADGEGHPLTLGDQLGPRVKGALRRRPEAIGEDYMYIQNRCWKEGHGAT